MNKDQNGAAQALLREYWQGDGVPQIDKGRTKDTDGKHRRHGDSAVALCMAVRASFMNGFTIDEDSVQAIPPRIGVSDSIDRLGASATGTFRTLTAGALGVAGMGYTANKLFISIASTRENQRIALNSLYKGDKEHADKMMQWAIQNAKDSTWGLTGVMQEFVSSKAFGMSDDETKNFITMLEDQGALKGWDLSAAQGASLQLKQMFSRQQITAADANLLTGYGINVYQVLADLWGKDVKKVRKQGEEGKLGIKSIIQLFQALSDEAKGAQKNAMNSWTGLTAQMGDVWEDFADKLMNKGPFERLKGQLRDVLGWYDRVPTLHYSRWSRSWTRSLCHVSGMTKKSLLTMASFRLNRPVI